MRVPPAAAKFSEENILRLFGNEAAENETLDRLKQYYVKSTAYEQVVSNTPLRVIVGHKGIGKSALIKVAISEDRERDYLAILIRPDDIVGIASEERPLLELIRDWKEGLTRLLAAKVIDTLGLPSADVPTPAARFPGRVLNFLTESLKVITSTVDLDPAKRAIVDHFLRTGHIVVYVDDLDRGWEGRIHDIRRISALLNAVRDMASDNPGLQFRVALRSDVYFLVRTSDESTDKIEGSVIWYSWTNHEILVLLIKRIETFFGRKVDDERLLNRRQHEIAYYLDSVMESKFTGRGHWENAPMYRVLMSLVRKRPRDLVKLCTAAAREAQTDRSPKIATKHFEAIFEDYSQGRIQDTINEYRTELPDIERLVMGMKPNRRERTARESYQFSTDELFKKLENIEETGSFHFATKREADRQDLAQFLYKINFLTARKELPTGEIQRKYFEENRYLSSRFVDFGYGWEIHPAYRWALQPDSLADLFFSIKLTADD